MKARLEAYLSEYLTANGHKTPRDVNKGNCEDFAIGLSKLLPDSEIVYTEDFVDWDSEDYPGGHVWVLFQGKHYDSECLNGAVSWKDLPFFQRRRLLQNAADLALEF